ncbi:GNAT family N-acetyltransferase [Chitinophaga sp. GCM10012297]|uniref:GNAT family N-acetyltransferase n=1 Tax=Chitinophaga chungangae TaxID=2821488 RepID=A0ABS3Y7Z4_9BACT|nr:GNAT family N-acetyltransferase [Chitinophaga chungangae]MBO9150798.1 GNAT family N-acetyltransferase [Chitinophaga chungangae]
MERKDKYSALDNPAWSALTSQHSEFAIGPALAKRYRADIVSFTGFAEPTVAAAAALDPLMAAGEHFFIIGEPPPLPEGWEVKNDLACVQMVCESPVTVPATVEIEPLVEKQAREMYDLVQLVQPGYYLLNTHRMGDYYGIRQEGKLVAIAGERMRTDVFTELSAICTHPDFTGRKYAQQLTAHLCRKNIEAGKIPFLHASTANSRAIGVYELMGFRTRREISFRLTVKNK